MFGVSMVCKLRGARAGSICWSVNFSLERHNASMQALGAPAGLAGQPPQLPPRLRGRGAWQAAAQQQLTQLSDAGLLTDMSRCRLQGSGFWQKILVNLQTTLAWHLGPAYG